MKENLLNILGIFLLIFGFLDGLKYHWLAEAIRKIKTAKGQSRKFINAALGKDIILFFYLIFNPDWYLILMTFIGFVFTLELMIVVYKFYPYRKRGLLNFKRPNIFLYTLNSILPNRIRKKL